MVNLAGGLSLKCGGIGGTVLTMLLVCRSGRWGKCISTVKTGKRGAKLTLNIICNLKVVLVCFLDWSKTDFKSRYQGIINRVSHRKMLYKVVRLPNKFNDLLQFAHWNHSQLYEIYFRSFHTATQSLNTKLFHGAWLIKSTKQGDYNLLLRCYKMKFILHIKIG